VTKFRIPFRYRTSLTLVIFSLIWLSLSCTYDPFQAPEMPIFYQTLNLPLTDVCLPLSDLHDPTNNIYGDSLLTFKFGGTLDKVTLPGDIFVIPSATSVEFEQGFADIDQANNPVSITIPQTIKFSTLFGLPLPQSEELTINPVPRMPLIDQDYSHQIFDSDSIPYFERVDYLTIGKGNFSTSIENEMLMAMDSVIIQMKNRDGSLIAESFYETIPPGETRSSNSDLRGKQIMDQVIISISAILAGTNDQPLTIPANTDPYLTLTIGVSITDIESVSGKPKPIETRVAKPLPESGTSIIRSVLSKTTNLSPDTNLISFGVVHSLPIKMDMNITFLNFYGESGAVNTEAQLDSGIVWEDEIRLDLDTLRNPNPKIVVDSFIVVISVEFPPDLGDTVTTIPIDFGDGILDFKLSVSALKFKEIEGFFHESIGSFTIPPMTIRDIPEGFGDVDFKEVWLKFYIYNEIQAQADLQFQIRGYRDSKEDSLLKDTTINKAASDSSEVLTNFGFNIAPIFNMMPDSITVFGSASITPGVTFKLEVGKSFRGIDSLIVPFTMKLNNDMIFIPVKSNELSPMDETTRQRIQEGLIESGITYKVINDFPFSGRVDLLMSNFDYFPLSPNSVDSAYWWNDTYDTLYTNTDTGIVSIFIDTLVTIELPTRDYNNEGQLKEFNGNSVIDSTMLEKIIGDEKQYIRPRIHLDSTSSYVSIQYDDEIDIVAILSLKMEAGALFGTGDADQDTTVTNSLKKPIGFKKK